MRENAETKGRRYLIEGRLTLRLVTPRRVEAVGRGSLGDTYSLSLTAALASCDCPARARCAHLIALRLVANRPRMGGTDEA
jgi:uncharacterized Zn finger protein